MISSSIDCSDFRMDSLAYTHTEHKRKKKLKIEDKQCEHHNKQTHIYLLAPDFVTQFPMEQNKQQQQIVNNNKFGMILTPFYDTW